MISELQFASAWDWSSVTNPRDVTFRDLICPGFFFKNGSCKFKSEHCCFSFRFLAFFCWNLIRVWRSMEGAGIRLATSSLRCVCTIYKSLTDRNYASWFLSSQSQLLSPASGIVWALVRAQAGGGLAGCSLAGRVLGCSGQQAGQEASVCPGSSQTCL